MTARSSRTRSRTLPGRLVAGDATYVSLNYDDPELRRIMPWAGTRHGRDVFIENFTGLTTRWDDEAFEITDTVAQAA